MRRTSRLAPLAGLLLLFGCAYRFNTGPSALPEGARTWRAPLFVNRTAEPNLEVLFTQAFREQLVRNGVDGDDQAQVWVKGEMLGISSGVTMIQTYRVEVKTRLALMQDDRELASTMVSDFEEFPRGRDPLLTESNRQAALRRLADSMMRRGYEQLASGS